MFGNLRFNTIFDNFLSPNQADLSAHCFYDFLTSNLLILRCNNNLIFPVEILLLNFKLGILMENLLFRIVFLNDQNTLKISP